MEIQQPLWEILSLHFPSKSAKTVISFIKQSLFHSEQVPQSGLLCCVLQPLPILRASSISGSMKESFLPGGAPNCSKFFRNGPTGTEERWRIPCLPAWMASRAQSVVSLRVAQQGSTARPRQGLCRGAPHTSCGTSIKCDGQLQYKRNKKLLECVQSAKKMVKGLKGKTLEE